MESTVTPCTAWWPQLSLCKHCTLVLTPHSKQLSIKLLVHIFDDALHLANTSHSMSAESLLAQLYNMNERGMSDGELSTLIKSVQKKDVAVFLAPLQLPHLDTVSPV